MTVIEITAPQARALRIVYKLCQSSDGGLANLARAHSVRTQVPALEKQGMVVGCGVLASLTEAGREVAELTLGASR